MTGYDLLKEVRASPELSQTPFIMITAESKTENVIAAKKAGVSNYIVKPFNAATLKTKMEAVFPDDRLTSWRAQRARQRQPPPASGHPRSCTRAADRPAPGPGSCSERPRRRAHQPYFYGLRFSQTDNVN